jgi:hypothetical protein
MDATTGTPTWVRNERMDLIKADPLGRSLFSPLFADPVRPVNNVRFHRTGTKRMHHPVVGDLELGYEAMELPANPGWTMFAYTAEPGSASDERLKLLASWAATTASEPAARASIAD